MIFLTKHKKFIIFCVVVIVVLLFSKFLFAYDDIIIHPILTGEMAELYNVNFSEKLTEEEIAWMKQGSTDEDKSLGLAIRSENHFYNPDGRKEWVDNSFRKEVVSTPALTSKEWAHDRLAQVTFPGGDYTWETAISDYAVGNKKRAYEGLGHILHLIEDAAVPAHTRSDLHISPKELEDYNNGGIWKKILGYYLTDYEPYESWTGNEAKSGGLKFGFAEKLMQENKKPIILDNLDKYFDNIAFYSNKNFFSKDTIYAYSEPKILYEKLEKIESGKTVGYVYGADENFTNFRLAKIDIVSDKKSYVIDNNIEGIEKVNFDYWSRLASNAVLNGAGVIKLFKDETEKYAKTPKLADSNPFYKIGYMIGKMAEDNTGPVLMRNYLMGKQLINNLAIYSLKQEAKLAGSTISNTYTIANNVLMKENRRAQEVVGEIKMIVSITYNKARSVVAVQYQRVQEVGIEAKYIGRVAHNNAVSGFSGAVNRIGSFAGIVSLTSPNSIELANKKINSNQESIEYITPINTSFIGPQLSFGPVLQKPIIAKNIISVPKINNNLIVSVPQNGNNAEVNDLSIEENAENLNNFSVANEQDNIIAIETQEEINDIVPENNLESIINYPPQIFTSADLTYYSLVSVSTPTLTTTVVPTPTMTPVPSLTPDLTFTPTPTPVPEIIPTPPVAPDITPLVSSNLPGKIADLVARTGNERGQVALSWSAPANAFSYDIIYSDIPFNESYASEYFVLNLVADNIASQNLSLDNLMPGKEFFFNIRSLNQEGDISDSSNIASAFSNGYADYPVISEIQIDSINGAGGTDDDWVELYNPMAEDISLAGWSIQRKLSSGNIYKKGFASDAKISAHGYYLIVSTKASVYLKDLADMIIGWSLTDDNTVSLISHGGKIVDKVGFGSSCEAEAVAIGNPPDGGSLERKAHRDSTDETMIFGSDKYEGNVWDADDNSQDFILRASSDPRGASDGYTEPRENTAPTISILNPQSSQLFLRGEAINFTVDIKDVEDLILPNEKISWVSDKWGTIGNGTNFNFNSLNIGANLITVNAIDSDNVIASAYADIFIRNNSWQNLGQIKDLGKNRNLNYPKIAVDSRGNAHMVAIESVGRGNLVYYTNESGEWKSYNVLKSTSATINSAEIKIDSQNNIFIIFELTGECFPQVSYIKKSAIGWGNPNYFSGFKIWQGYSTAIDSSGEIYSVINAVKPRYLCMNYDDKGFRFNRTIDGELQKEIVIPAPEKTTIYLPQVAVDKNNIPYLFASARTREQGIFYTSFDKSANVFNSWKKVNLTFDSVSALPVVPRFDDANNIHLFILETSIDPKEIRGIWHMESADFKTWIEEKLPVTDDINKSWFDKWKFEPLFDYRGKIHLVWQRDKNLLYQTNFGGEWTNPMDILGEGIYGVRPALTIDKSNNLHLIYQPFDKNLQEQINYAINPEIE